MNKASFLTLVRQASRISDQDVEELEKLVVNFPYCQTAHLLIAKAAYDKGSMLSNQKLKKAAIYAANRQLLKKLIYTSDATVQLHPVSDQETVAETAEKVAIPEAPVSETVNGFTIPEPENLEEIETHEAELDAKISSAEISNVPDESEIVPDTVTEAVEPEIAAQQDPELSEEIQETENENIPAELSEILTALTEVETKYEDAAIAEEILEEGYLPETEAEFLGKLAETEETFDFAPALDFEFLPEETVLETIGLEAEKVPEPEISEPLAEIPEPETVVENADKVQEMVSEAAHTLEDVPDMHELFLENAPEILQPESLDEIATEPITETSAEKITQLNDELLHETLASFDQYLFRPEKEIEEPVQEEEDLKVVNPKDAIQEIFEKDSLGYWMSSSRMGECLQLKNELTKPQPYEFYPELILEYSKTHELEKEIKPTVSNLSRQLEIIDEFLKLTPRLKTMANAKVKTEPQEDLSSKSSKINKNLASENFANILVQQGKIKKAIKIYEHLILKIPEKKAYFVAQIEKLQNPA